MDKKRIGTICLASCTGCHMALLDTGDAFLGLLTSTTLTFSPVLADSKEILPADLILVEGSVRSEKDLHALQEARAKAGLLVAMGTCATFGGVPGLADSRPVEEIMDSVYNHAAMGEKVPALRPRLLPLDAYVDIDYYITGCPPPREHMANILKAFLSGQEPPRIETPVCSECRRQMLSEPLQDMVRPFNHKVNSEKCLLMQGLPCLGSATRGGCGAACTHVNVPCTGCRGPTDHVLLESWHGVYRDLVLRISHLLGWSTDQVEHRLGDLPHVLYSYSLGSPAMRRKDAERVSRLVYRIKERSKS